MLKATRAIWSEPETDRLVGRLTRIAAGELDQDEAQRLVDGDLDVVTRLSPSVQQGVLALVRRDTLDVLSAYKNVQGNTVDFVPIAYLDVARLAALSVGRVIFRAGNPQGTGVLVSNRLFLTNNHVMGSADSARVQSVQFNFERDMLGRPAPVTEFAFDPDALFVTSPKDDLDFALVAVGDRIGGPCNLVDFGSRSLSGARDKHAEGDFVSIVQHPSGDYKQIVLRENRVLGRGARGTTLYYGTDTLPGSSGSPVFNDQYELVALHHAGRPVTDTELDSGRPVPQGANEGIRISAIVADLKARGASLTAEQRRLLDAAIKRAEDVLLQVTGSATSGTDDGEHRVEVQDPVTKPEVVVPLTIQVRLDDGTGIVAMPRPPRVGETAWDAFERNEPPDDRYENRDGYDSAFLGVKIPLPALSTSLRRHVATITETDESVLDYYHFSIVMHADRRLPIFTAVNLDGPTWKQINRETRVVTNPFESAETWYQDPRIDPRQQFSQDDYAKISRYFDRGHMVRREDPQWGTGRLALLAMDDTFHFTNCCPQNWRFNERAQFWQGIENYVLNGMRNTPERVSVFTGPIMTSRDPRREGIQVPLAFWKIVVRVVDDKLRATGFIASQRPLLDDAREAIRTQEWAIEFDEPIAGFQARVTEIERRTGLRLPAVVRSADTLVVGFESTEGATLLDLADPSQASW